ncbi:ASB_HP2_G0035630.mRNA.1.CDS.1 [Saccharomyces cerevisiae]|nr:ASB_HP2_G0035630.mRNA.1.CDS.1 [Saccharomyces cerevisiae]CAI6640713.1 ASB_HP1_G0034880.mRNA.1.CDS.1 [Saccharomyces cerevisiae]CAI6648497.1 ASB_HP2_G0035630.mRNA.1.CDS.1 [Saccharomyces cerevisiae]
MSRTASYAGMTTPVKDKEGHGIPCLQPIDVVECTYQYFTKSQNKLSLRVGDLIYVLTKGSNGWWDGVLIRHSANNNNNSLILDRGWFPPSFTRSILNELHGVPEIGNELEIFQAGLNLKLELSSNPVILSLEDFLDCCRDIEFKEQLAWSPIPVHERKGCCELLYYNQDLDVYCRTLPYLPQNQVETVNDYSSFPAISKIAGKKMPITSSPDLFYLNDCDVVYWYDLTRLVCHYVNLTERDLLANEREKFLTSLDLLTAQITCVYMLFRNLRLVEDSFKKTLKKLIYTLSRFSINANIWFHSTPFEEREAIASQKDPERRSPLLQSILGTFQKFHFLLRLLHFLSNPNELTILPQLTPRFFKDSFNTISWNNPFLRKHLNQHMSHDLPRQMIKAVAGASGIVAENIDEIPASKQGTSCSSETSHHSPSAPFQRRRRGTIFSNVPGSSDESDTIWSKRKKPYPLNEETLSLVRARKEQLDAKLKQMIKSANEYLSNTANFSKMLNFEMNFKTYEEVSGTIPIIDILKNLDLTIYLNLRELGDENRVFDEDVAIDDEDKEFLKHSLSSLSYILSDYFNMKQYFHDVVVKFIIVAQHLTLEDPFVFSPMQNDLPTGYYEPMKPSSLNLDNAKDKKNGSQNTDIQEEEDEYEPDPDSLILFHNLINQDSDFNDLKFFNLAHVFKKSCDDYFDVLKLSIEFVNRLILERENLLNYAARMMKNNITELLLRGEEGYGSYDGGETAEKSDTNAVYADSDTKDNDEWRDSQVKLPRYLQREYDSELIWGSNNRIKGGSKHALISYLTDNEKKDLFFDITFLITFRSIFTTTEFLSYLISQYNLDPPEDLCFEEYNEWVTKKLIPVKCRVVEIMTTFFKQYWFLGYDEPDLATLNLDYFAQVAIKENITGSVELLKEVNQKFKHGNMQEATAPMKTLDQQICQEHYWGTLYSTTESILAVDPVLFATQLTILEHEIYCEITIFDCLQKIWKNKYTKSYGASPGLNEFISFANKLTNFISYSIVKEADKSKRAKLLSHFIFIAEYCRKFNNFSSMTAIISALYSSSIYRLEKTWQAVIPQTRDLLQSLDKLMDPKKNFINYRSELKSLHSAPCVPFFGVYLSDLTFTDSGNPDYLVLEHGLKGVHDEKKYINFNKRSRLVDILQEIIYFKKTHYDFTKDRTVIECISNSLENIPHIEKQYQLSLIIEPKPRKKVVPNSNSNNKSQEKSRDDQTDEGKTSTKKDRFSKFQLHKTKKKAPKVSK